MSDRRKKRYRIPSRQQIELLRALLELRGSGHGYTLMKTTGLSQGTLYGLLKRLHDDGYLTRAQATVNGRERVQYALSSAGAHYAERALIEDELERGLATSPLETP